MRIAKILHMHIEPCYQLCIQAVGHIRRKRRMGLFAVCDEIRTHRSRTRSAESAGPLRVILDSVAYH